jgi:hypothetical protein
MSVIILSAPLDASLALLDHLVLAERQLPLLVVLDNCPM